VVTGGGGFITVAMGEMVTFLVTFLGLGLEAASVVSLGDGVVMAVSDTDVDASPLSTETGPGDTTCCPACIFFNCCCC